MRQSTALEALVASMSLSDLAGRSGKTVEDIVSWALSGARVSAAAKMSTLTVDTEAGASAVGRGGKRSSVNTRTPQGREGYDESVIAILLDSKSPVGATEIRRKVGGTALQVRTALNRLIGEGKVSYQGRARATRYVTA